jgi:hypothetical protein
MMSRRRCLGHLRLHNRAVGWHILQERTAQCAISDFDGSLLPSWTTHAAKRV